MSWRNQGITGSNNIPLGKTRRFGGEAEPEDAQPSFNSGSNSAPSQPSYSGGFNGGDRDAKRGRSPEPSKSGLP